MPAPRCTQKTAPRPQVLSSDPYIASGLRVAQRPCCQNASHQRITSGAVVRAVVRQRFLWIPATDTDIISAQHFCPAGLETAGPGCYDAVAIARTAGSECWL